MNTCLSILLAVSSHLGLDGDYNSESNASYYVGKKILNFEIGLVTGYNSYGVLPMIRYIKDGWFVAPAYEKSGKYGIAVGYEYMFK